jgi:hypothetical protein
VTKRRKSPKSTQFELEKGEKKRERRARAELKNQQRE